MKIVKRILGISAAILLVAPNAFAATATSNLEASATVVKNCTITTTPLAFGSYDPIVAHKAANLDGTGGVSVTCTSEAVTSITLGQGLSANTGSTADAPLRRLKNGTTNFLSYSVFSETGRTVIWGDTTATDVDHTGTGAAIVHTAYGRIAMDQKVPAGSYADTLVATVTF